MARIRTVKPELWTDPEFVECSPNARLLFVAALNFASDYGVLADKPKQLKMQCLPADSVDVGALVDELVAARLWVRTETPDGEKVLVIRTFNEHQRVDKPSKTARYGDPRTWANSRNPPGGLSEDSTSPPEKSCAEGNGRERKGRERELSSISDIAQDKPVDKWSDDVKQRRSQIITAEANLRADQRGDEVRSRGPYVAKVIQELNRDYGQALDLILAKHPHAPNDAIAQRIIHDDMTIDLATFDETNAA